VASSPEGGLAKLIAAYLSEAHRDGWETSCAVTTLAADVARSGARARAAYTRQVVTYLDLVSSLIAGAAPQARRRRAILALSALVGAVSLARAVSDTRLSREILAASARELEERLGGGGSARRRSASAAVKDRYVARHGRSPRTRRTRRG
jgi:TetR/AcrR family transcriptional repressor of nem operon